MGRFSIKSLHSLLELQTHTKSTARLTSTFYPGKMGQKRKCLSLDTKVAIIRQVKEGQKPKQAIAAEHEIRASSLSTILKNSDKILADWEANREGQRRRMRLSPYDEVEKALYAWFIDIRTTQNIPLSGPIIRAKATELANKMGITDFTASTGWFDRFKRNATLGIRYTFHIPFTIKNNISKKCRSLGFTSTRIQDLKYAILPLAVNSWRPPFLSPNCG